MSTIADPLFIKAEVERRLELAGVDPTHPERRPVLPVATHPLLAVVARLVGARPQPHSGVRRGRLVVAGRRPRHP